MAVLFEEEKNIINFIIINGFISPLKRARPFFWTILNPLHQKYFVSSLVEIGPVVLEKKIFKFRQCIFTIS